ncbi:hypothetical protein SEVIR_5G457950v4 [Setaria viridis]
MERNRQKGRAQSLTLASQLKDVGSPRCHRNHTSPARNQASSSSKFESPIIHPTRTAKFLPNLDTTGSWQQIQSRHAPISCRNRDSNKFKKFERTNHSPCRYTHSLATNNFTRNLQLHARGSR